MGFFLAQLKKYMCCEKVYVLFPPTAERGGENYDLLYQNSIREYEDDLEY